MEMGDLEVQVRLRANSSFPVYHDFFFSRERTSFQIHLEVMTVIVEEMSAHGITVYEL
jgi:hypothetical protein